jgi:hypothetical protein
MVQEKTILLHLGTHKTGSTAIQRNFARNRDRIADHGLRYLGPGGPFPHLYSAFLPDPMAYMWNRGIGLTLEQILERDAEAVADLQRRIEAVRKPKVLVSNEYLAMLPEDSMALLREAFTPLGRVQAVYVYRELHAWWSSNTQEMAKTGTATGPTPFDRALQRVVGFPLKIARVFGAANCHFLRFEDLAPPGVCSGFLRALGQPDFPAMGLTETRENVSISGAAVEALFDYNRSHGWDDPARDAAEVERLKALPGPGYRVPGFTEAQIEVYAEARARVLPLGLQLAEPGALPRHPR